jgi:hypothetical protein
MTGREGVWLSDRAWLYVVLWFIGLNAFDLAMTLRTVDLGAVELNPVMASALAAGLGWAVALKGVVTAGVAAGLWFGRRHRIVRRAGVGFVAAFVALAAYQLLNLWSA